MTKYFSRRVAICRILFACVLVVGWISDSQGACGPQGCIPTRNLPTTNPISSLPSPVVASIRSVVRVRHETPSGASLGTATLVATRNNACYFATCAHLFDEGKGRTTLLRPSQSTISSGLTEPLVAEIIALDRQHDVALLRSKRCDLIPVATNTVPSSGELIACGFGSAGQMRAIRGPFVGKAMPTGATMPSLRMRGAVRPGDSGGPVFDSLGRLVAIVWGERGGETYAIYGGPLQKILARIPRPLQAIQSRPQPVVPTVPPRPLSEPAWLDRLENRIGSLEDNLGESNRKLEGFAKISQPIIPLPRSQNPTAPLLSIPTDGGEVDGGTTKRSPFSKLVTAWKVSEFFLGAASVGGPIGIALLVGNLWLQRRKIQQATTTIRSDQRRPIAVDSPPPPQRIVPETRYVSYEKDEFAKAHQWASEQLARKFPGSVEMLSSLDSLIRQQLAGSRDH